MTPPVNIRSSGEVLDLIVAAIASSVIVFFLGIISGGVVCFWAIVGIIVVIITISLANSRLRETSDRVDENYPDLKESVEESSRKMGITEPEVYIYKSSSVNAYTRGLFRPVVVLQKGLLDVMGDKEVLFTLGHEMGHIRLRHSPLKTLFESGMTAVPLILYLPLLAFRHLFFRGKLSRSMERSADRAGLYVCNDINSAVGCLLKLRLGRDVGEDAVMDAIRSGFSGGGSGSLLSSHPATGRRISDLVKFSKSSGIGWKRELD